jgi:subtilisin family serine protease
VCVCTNILFSPKQQAVVMSRGFLCLRLLLPPLLLVLMVFVVMPSVTVASSGCKRAGSCNDTKKGGGGGGGGAAGGGGGSSGDSRDVKPVVNAQRAVDRYCKEPLNAVITLKHVSKDEEEEEGGTMADQDTPELYARRYGIRYVGRVGYFEDMHEFELACIDDFEGNTEAATDLAKRTLYRMTIDAKRIQKSTATSSPQATTTGKRKSMTDNNKDNTDGNDDGYYKDVEQRFTLGNQNIENLMQQPRMLHPRRDMTPPVLRSTTGAVADSSIRTVNVPDVQWHLKDAGNAATAHIIGAWGCRAYGSGQLISVVDDGLNWRHPDIEANYLAELSANYNGRGHVTSSSIGDPYPDISQTHGTSAAGTVAAGGHMPYTVCGFGVARASRVAGVRLIAAPVTDATEARGVTHGAPNVTVYSCSWGPEDSGTVLSGPGPLTSAAIMDVARNTGRGGLGSVYVWAAGNGAQDGDACWADGYTGHPDVVPVAAVTHLGKVARYSEACPAMMLSAPSSGDGRSIYTTSSGSGCTDSFGGTSAAAPFVAGVAALIASVKPQLRGKDIVRIMVETARQIDHTDRSWIKNAAGRWHSDRYGFGVVDAHEAVALASQYQPSSRSDYTSSSSPFVTNGMCACGQARQVAMPCLLPNGVSNLMPCTTDLRFVRIHTAPTDSVPRSVETNVTVVERVEVLVNVQHSRRGEVSFSLLSPSGTRATAYRRPRDLDLNYDWWPVAFSGFWGESPVGLWQLDVTDNVPGRFTGYLIGWKIIIYGRK